MSETDKARRQQAIVALLRGRVLRSQEELRRALDELGWPVTQATLSRDLKELSVRRVASPEGYRYELPGEAEAAPPARLGSVTALEVTGVEANEVAVIVRTLSGRAQGVGVYLDALHNGDVLGTIAGDDTVLVLPTSIKKTERLRRFIAAHFQID